MKIDLGRWKKGIKELSLDSRLSAMILAPINCPLFFNLSHAIKLGIIRISPFLGLKPVERLSKVIETSYYVLCRFEITT